MEAGKLKCFVKKCIPDFSKTDAMREYRRIEAHPGGTLWCWEPDLFHDLDNAKGVRVVLDVVPSDDDDPRTGKPYVHVVGFNGRMASAFVVPSVS